MELGNATFSGYSAASVDLREDKETQDIIAKLSELSDKVAAAKARALANRAQRLADESKG